MKIKFIGTSDGKPTAERYCSCMMIEIGESLYLVDVGAPAAEEIMRCGKSLSSLRAVFTTHTHSDHTCGLARLCGLLNWLPNCSADIFVTEQNLIDAASLMMEVAGDGAPSPSRVRFKIPTAGIVYEDENIKVEYIPTKHSSKCLSYAILVTEGEKRVLFGGDFSTDLKRGDIPDTIEEELDAFICEMAHFNLEQARPYLERCNAKKVFFTHVFPLSKYDDIKSAKGDFRFETFTPNDGDWFEI